MAQFNNFPSVYANGMNVAWASSKTLTINAGQVRDPTNSFDILIQSTITLNGLGVGLNGLDQGVLANNTMYYVFVIYDYTFKYPVGTLLSTSINTPLMPFNYTNLRRIGVCKTDGSANFLKFTRKQSNSNKVFHEWETPISILTAGAVTTFTAVSCAAAVPTSAETFFMNLAYTPTATASTSSIRPTGSAAASGSTPIVLKSNVAAVAVNYPMVRSLGGISGSNVSIDYLVASGDALTITVPAFIDIL